MECKVSIIVPVYNMEEYIERCLESLRLQRLKEIEIIVVDDGSTDRSSKLIDEFVRKDSRFVLIRQKNQGLSGARNTGLSIASGDYIGFVDSDDFVEKDMYEALYKKAVHRNAQIVECDLFHTYMNHEDIEYGKEIIDHREMLMVGRSVVWNKIYKRQWLKETGITFAEKVYYEDVDFYARLIPLVERYEYVHKPLIHYVQRCDSINNKSSKRTMDIFKILDGIRLYYKMMEYEKTYAEALEYLFIRILLGSSFIRICHINDGNQRKRILAKNYDFLCRNYPSWHHNPYLRQNKSAKGWYMKMMNTYSYRLSGLLCPYILRLKSLTLRKA